MSNATLLLAACLALAGCAAPATPERTEVPVRPAPLPKRYDYSPRVLKDSTESERAQHIEELYGEKLAARNAPRPPAPAPEAWELPPEPRKARRVHRPTWHRSYRYDHAPYRHYRYDSYRNRHYRHHYRGRYHSGLPIGNTVLYGTLGGIIGHQSDHRDEGILIGAGYGLLLDLFGH